MLNHLVNHRCHLYQGTNTSTCAAGHAMLTARRPSLLESLYSSSMATLMIILPVSVVSGPETARNPSLRAPSSDSNSTCCPGSGTRGGLLLPNVISSTLEPPERLGDRGLPGQDVERLVVSVLVFERGCKGTGYVFAGDLTPPFEPLGRLYRARALILTQAARTVDAVIEPTARQSLVG